jgi:hypothetical protein
MEGGEATPASTSLQDRVTAAVMLKPWVYRELAADGSATGQAVLVAFLAALVSGLGACSSPLISGSGTGSSPPS